MHRRGSQSLTHDGNTRTCQTDQGCVDMDDLYNARSDLISNSQADENCIDEENSNVLRQVHDEEAGSTAALMLEKFYLNLSGSAVLARRCNWWNLNEGATFRETSEQFCTDDKHQTVAARWAQLKTKAAKVGHGLSKDKNARKLAAEHWLEVIDPKHRYGHNLHLYYDVWLESETHQPFFYWLDVGGGRDLSLPACSRSKLQNQQITYLGPKEREQFEVVIENRKLMYKQSRRLVNTSKGDKWIFVMCPSKKLYVHQKEKGSFQHSSFLAGGATVAAGRLVVKDGDLELLDAHSGHYHPKEENFNVLVDVLVQNGADLSKAKVQYVSDEMLQSHFDSHTACGQERESTEDLEKLVQNEGSIHKDQMVCAQTMSIGTNELLERSISIQKTCN